MRKIIAPILCLSLVSCAYIQDRTAKKAGPDVIAETLAAGRMQAETRQPTVAPPAPDFLPVKEESSPLATQTVSVSARNTPLRDVLYTIAEVAHLNLIMEKGVDPEFPVTVTCKNIPVEDALDIIFDSADYFYEVENNLLIVKAMNTEIFEMGQPNVTQEYKVDVGGDILSGIASSSEQSNSSLSGDVSMKSVSDKTSFQFWDAVESSLKILLGTEAPLQDGVPRSSFITNRMTGTIMVTASKRSMINTRDYIRNLKKVLNRQVLIEARIVEVQLSEGLKYGIDWTEVGKWLGVGKMTLGTALFSDVVSTTGPNFQLGITENDNLSLVLRALEQQGDVKTLSNPRVNIMNGQTAMLSVGRNTTFISRVETTTTVSDASAPVTTFTVDTNSILSGIMFGLVPYIGSNGEVTLTITPIVSNLVDLEAKSIGSGGNSVEIKLPTVDLREMSTTVKVLDGQLIIIGGLIDRAEKIQKDKVPLLGNIPVLGEAFTRLEKTYENKELVIMLIPRLLI